MVEYEPDSELRDFEQIPLLEEGGIEAFIRREVLPYTPDAWIVEADTKIGYEISFTRHFYQPPQLRTLAEISADILELETGNRRTARRNHERSSAMKEIRGKARPSANSSVAPNTPSTTTSESTLADQADGRADRGPHWEVPRKP